MGGVMRIHMPEVEREGNFVKLKALVEQSNHKGYLWYSVPYPYQEYLVRERADAFVVGLLLLAMKNGEDIYVNGAMSEKLFYNLTHYYMHILRLVIPNLHFVKIVCKQLHRPIPNPRGGVATGFSGGVDSFCVLNDHFFGEITNGYRITHLTFHNVGPHLGGWQKLFEERFAHIQPCAQELGLPIIKIDSNLDEWLSLSGLHFSMTHTSADVSAVLTLQGLIRCYLYASGYKYKDCCRELLKGAHDIAAVDPMSVHLLSTEATECISVGSQYSRVEKTIRISDLPVTYRYLNVCVKGRVENCSKCEKCLRTILTLEIIGKIDRYQGVFNLAIYQRNKTRFIGRILWSRDSLHREIIKYARENQWRVPVSAWLYSVPYLIAKIIRSIVGKGKFYTILSIVRRHLTRFWKLL